MGRDIGFVREEIGFHGFWDVHEIRETGLVIGHNVKTHRSDDDFMHDFYEDYGVLLWMDKDGNLKKKCNKKVMLEEQRTRPMDFVKVWDVPIEIGDYGVEAVNWRGEEYAEREVSVFQIEDIIPRNDRGGAFELVTKHIGHITHENSFEAISVKEIQEKFDEKFWKGVKKASKIPKKITESDE